MEQDELLRKLVETLERLDVPYLLTGSIATIFYGEPRFTNDIDVVVQLDEPAVAGLLEAFPAPEFYLSAESIRRAIATRRQFNVIHPSSGLKVDVMVAAMTEHDRSRFARARRLHPAAGYTATFAAPEDVILKKLEYFQAGGSDKHLRDIAGVLAVTPDVDRDYIALWSDRLGVGDLWRELVARGTPGASR